MAFLGLVCAGYWFGNTGLGLALLWMAARGIGSGPEAVAWRKVLAEERLTFSHVTARRVLLVGARSGRLEVFRDEVDPAGWAALRRGCLRPQPATGRSTSI